MKTVIESQYFPCMEYLRLLKSKNEIWIDPKERYEKQSYRNRCYILTSNKTLSLAVPVKVAGKHTLMDQVEIDYGQKWVNNHWRAIISAYNKSPFFEYYEPYIYDILYSKHVLLLDLNKAILSFCLKVLQIDTVIHYSENYVNHHEGQIDDKRSKIHPKKDYLCGDIHVSLPYRQVFGQKFVANLSILDVLSCTGPESGKYL